jgi:glutathione S-transferase
VRVWQQAVVLVIHADRTLQPVQHTCCVPVLHPYPQKPEAKDTYWQTHGAKDSANGNNGGAHFDYLESLLAANAGGAGFFVGSGLTAADLCVWQILDLHMRLFKEQVEATVSHTQGCGSHA